MKVRTFVRSFDEEMRQVMCIHRHTRKGEGAGVKRLFTRRHRAEVGGERVGIIRRMAARTLTPVRLTFLFFVVWRARRGLRSRPRPNPFVEGLSSGPWNIGIRLSVENFR